MLWLFYACYLIVKVILIFMTELDIEPEIGLQRVLDRDGAQLEAPMRQWQVDQDKHFARDETRENCEFKLTS